MCGGKVSRERFCAARRTEIAATAGQKIRVSGRASNAWASTAGILRYINKGETINAKTHTKIGTIAYLSSFALGAGPLKAARDAARLCCVSELRTRFASDIRECMPWLISRIDSVVMTLYDLCLRRGGGPVALRRKLSPHPDRSPLHRSAGTHLPLKVGQTASRRRSAPWPAIHCTCRHSR